MTARFGIERWIGQDRARIGSDNGSSGQRNALGSLDKDGNVENADHEREPQNSRPTFDEWKLALKVTAAVAFVVLPGAVFLLWALRYHFPSC